MKNNNPKEEDIENIEKEYNKLISVALKIKTKYIQKKINSN